MCDSFCSLVGDRTWFAKSSDRPIDEVQVAEVFDRRPAGGTVPAQYLAIDDAGAAAVLGCRPTWLWGFEMGLNEHGVAIGNERVYTVRDDESLVPEALIGMDLVRLGLERAADADQAVEVIGALLAAHGQGGIADATSGEGYFSSFLVADRRGAWVLETAGSTWAARPTATGPVAISNRLHLADDWTVGSADLRAGASFQDLREPAVPTGFADVRAAATTAVAERAGVDARHLAAGCRDHGGHPWGRPGGDGPGIAVDPVPGPVADFDGTGVSVCMHIRGFQATAASLLTDLPADPGAPLRAWVALGSPCVSVYVPVFPPPAAPGGVAPALATEATWLRFRALRQRVETAHDAGDDEAMRAVRAVLGPLEDELWAEADAVAAAWRGDDDPAATAFAATVGSRLDAALARLGV
jgi:secernin